MNLKPIDSWTFTHFIFGIFLAIFIINKGFNVLLSIFLLIFFELMEHLIIGDLIFNWKKREKRELPINAIYDIIFGICGVFIGFILV
ncbi:MAG: hypothetical protein LN408_03245 [Candidatus Thermoplasmatota archaeon]|nr:hypothetical protein [Candidatus Thermoplasmatota archaeon]